MRIVKIIKTVGIVVLIAVIAILITAVSGQKKHIKTLKSQVKQQSATIDSLLRKKEISFNVSLNVTDKSVNKVNAKKGSGIVNMPQSNEYIIKLDSLTINALK
jgi:predicted Holliday junction resolvase-like endonuclease